MSIVYKLRTQPLSQFDNSTINDLKINYGTHWFYKDKYFSESNQMEVDLENNFSKSKISIEHLLGQLLFIYTFLPFVYT